MAHDFITNKILEDTADAIRYCEDSVAQIAPKDFAARIRELKYPKPTWLYFTLPQGGTVTLIKNGTPTEVTLEYSVNNGNTWTEWVENENVRSLTLAAGQTMHVRNTSETSTMFSTSINDYYQFAFTTDTYAGGNINSLLCKNPEDAIITPHSYAYLFYYCSKLLSAPELPATELAFACYYQLFAHTGLIMAPELPATELQQWCYGNMFSGCRSLIKAPYLPANVILSSSYAALFAQCTNINEIYTSMTDISVTRSIIGWVENVSPIGDFYCPAELTIPTGASGIPSGWTRHDI